MSIYAVRSSSVTMSVMSKGTQKVLVATSGGVDSSLAAALLLRDGYDVVGVYMHTPSRQANAHAQDARRVADKLGIPLHEIEPADEFRRIIGEFAALYARGRTPNPCIRCNRLIKFGLLLNYARDIGADYLATGHHARIGSGPNGACIKRAMDNAKDQSYVLFAIPRRRLESILLPVGKVDNKDQIRNEARRVGLDVHDKPESQEICFVTGGDYADILARFSPEALTPGDIVDSSGKVVGRHEGYGKFTIGQRRGLGVAAGEPMYVTKIEPDTARVVIGPRSEVLSRRLSASNANWHLDLPESFQATVKIRYNHPGAPGRVRITGPQRFEVEFDRPVPAVAPGQAAVAYKHDTLLGGGWIE